MIRLVPLACLLAALLLPSFGAAQDKKDIKGAIQEIDPVIGTITLIEAEGKSQRVKTYSLARPDLPVTDAAGKPLKLADLMPDHRVYLKMAGDDVIAIRKALPTMFGTLKKIDLTQRFLFLKTNLGDKTVEFPADVKVVSANQPGQLKDLKIDYPLLVTYSQDQQTVVELKTGKGLLPVQKLVKLIGFLIEIDRDKRTVQILGSNTGGDYYPLRDLPLAPDAGFSLLHQAKPFRDLAGSEVSRGVKVYYWSDMLTHKVAHVQIEMPILAKRVVKTIDAAERRLVLEDAEGERTLTLSAQVKVRSAQGTAKVEDIKPRGIVSCGLSPDRKSVELVVLNPK